MKSVSYDQFAIVHADSASLFNEQLNAEIYRLRDAHPTVHFSESIPFYAQIKYRVDETIPESVADAAELEGVRFVCGQCPFFKPMTKADGTEDKRCKWGECEHAELGRVLKNSTACDRLFEEIKKGGVRLCFAE